MCQLLNKHYQTELLMNKKLTYLNKKCILSPLAKHWQNSLCKKFDLKKIRIQQIEDILVFCFKLIE